MDDKDVRKHEQRGYARGYHAGLKRREHELRQMQMELAGAVELRRERIFCAVISGLLASGNNSNWKIGDVPVNNSKTYTELTKAFVIEAMAQMKF